MTCREPLGPVGYTLGLAAMLAGRVALGLAQVERDLGALAREAGRRYRARCRS